MKVISRKATPQQKFVAQRHGAKTRGVEWLMTFDQWWNVWEESGKWKYRGQGGYCMARKGDFGPYSPDNVYICTIAQNMHDAHARRQGRPAADLKVLHKEWRRLRRSGKSLVSIGKAFGVSKQAVHSVINSR